MVLVRSAQGRDILEQARKPYAYSLWLYLHLDQLEYFDEVKRQNERYDLAGLFAMARLNPKQLAEEHQRFIGSFARAGRTTKDWRALVEARVEAHKKLIPVAP